MKVTKQFLNEVLEETIEEFNSKVYPLKNKIELQFEDNERFMDNVKSNELIQMQIRMGFYKNIDKEYPNFLVVYQKNKLPMLELLGLPYKVTICFEKAKDILKPYSKESVVAYLKHGFAHEIGHIVQDSIIKERPNLWNEHLEKCANDDSLAKESMVEDIADLIGNKQLHEEIEESIWALVRNRMKKIRGGVV